MCIADYLCCAQNMYDFIGCFTIIIVFFCRFLCWESGRMDMRVWVSEREREGRKICIAVELFRMTNGGWMHGVQKENKRAHTVRSKVTAKGSRPDHDWTNQLFSFGGCKLCDLTCDSIIIYVEIVWPLFFYLFRNQGANTRCHSRPSTTCNVLSKYYSIRIYVKQPQLVYEPLKTKRHADDTPPSNSTHSTSDNNKNCAKFWNQITNAFLAYLTYRILTMTKFAPILKLHSKHQQQKQRRYFRETWRYSFLFFSNIFRQL